MWPFPIIHFGVFHLVTEMPCSNHNILIKLLHNSSENRPCRLVRWTIADIQQWRSDRDRSDDGGDADDASKM